MLCRQWGNPLLIAFGPGGSSRSYATRLTAYAAGLGVCRPGSWALWAISPLELENQEGFARDYGLEMPLLADTGAVVAKSFGVAPADGEVGAAVFLVAPDRTLLWKDTSVHCASRHLPWEVLQRLAA